MTGAELRDICEARFGDPSNTVRTEAEWLTYLNAAYREFVRRSRWPALVASAGLAFLAGSRTATLTSAAQQGGVSAVIDANGDPLVPMPEMEPKARRFMGDQPSVPLYWEQLGNLLSVLPAPLANMTLTVQYLTAPTALAAGTSPVIPETHQDALIAGALARAYRDDGQPELASAYDNEFAAYVMAANETSEAGAE